MSEPRASEMVMAKADQQDVDHCIDRSPDGWLYLADGTRVEGFSFGAKKPVSGEVVFNTGMVGYPESLTDPSYRGQILVLTYPLVGNYGVPSFTERDELGLLAHFESEQIQVAGLIVSNYASQPSHYQSHQSLGSWLEVHGIPAIFGVDTRMLTKKLRSEGSMLGKIVFSGDDATAQAQPWIDPNKRNLVAEVSRKKPELYTPQSMTAPKIKIVAVDCGMKNNIIRYFVRTCGVQLKVVPWDWDLVAEAAGTAPTLPGELCGPGSMSGLFLSNGPGDPALISDTIQNLKWFLQQDDERIIPVFGICMGNQLLGLAAGCRTYKMKYGNRGMNQPVIDLRTTLCYITPQNHGYAIDNESLPADWKVFFINANDSTNEGLIHVYKPFFSAQFHPEHKGGPTDTEFLFDMFLQRVRDRRTMITTVAYVPTHGDPIRKVLLLGSGGLSIGQAGEFDYSGSQAIKALKEESKYVVLINPNIATVQTSYGMADQVYFLPLTCDFIAQVIEKERPDGILLQFGGQTALNAGIELQKQGILEKYGVRVLGTQVDVIESTEDREIFSRKLAEIGETCAPSKTCYTVEEALVAAKEIGYPVLVRAGFALGGLGSGFAENESDLETLVRKSFNFSSQVIVDKSLVGWKEVEYEVVRDGKNNCITVCNMENFDPLGIHTGDSIVVAPSQTLTNEEFYMLRRVALKVVRHLGVVGECNIQYALDPTSKQYVIIEVNARLSRSSALASKATGFPLAYVAAKIALGLALTDIKNSVTKTTVACFEPALDYVCVKFPRFDLKKFQHVSDRIGSSMKSVGEVMAIGRSFEETFQKAIRMVDTNMDGLGDTKGCAFEQLSTEELNSRLAEPSDQRLLALAVALQRGGEEYTIDKLYKLTAIDRWFLWKMKHIIRTEEEMKKMYGGKDVNHIPYRAMLACKQLGFSDRQIARCVGSTPLVIRQHRHDLGVRPWVKQVDTLAAEFPAQTNYLYLTYHGSEHDVEFEMGMSSQLSVAAAAAAAQGFMTPSPRGSPSGSGGGNVPWSTPKVLRRQVARGRQQQQQAPTGSMTSPWGSGSFVPPSAVTDPNHSVIVLGCGAYRIGSSCEFDWCAVSCIRALNKLGFKSIMINYNPETVSTDYDECSRLYFEELSFEVVMDIYELEDPRGVVVSVGGQIPNNLAIPLYTAGVRILGTSPSDIDTAENRQKFSALMDRLDVDQPIWNELRSIDDAKSFANQVGYPVLVRPSYVLSGAAMNVAYNDGELVSYLSKAVRLSAEYPVVISKFIVHAKEIEYDGVAQEGNIINFAISEHIENAGVHSGDATLLLPAQKLYAETIKRIKKISAKIARALHISGPFNIQYLSKNNDIKVIECNLRASRSVPFVSKTFNVNFIELATKIMVGSPFKAHRIELIDIEHVCVKVPMFSFTRLQGADPVLRVEMASTGEVACFSSRPLEAFLKGLLATGSFKLPREHKSILLSLGPLSSKMEFLESAQTLIRLGYTLYGTTGTAEFYAKYGVKVTPLNKPEHLRRAARTRRNSVGGSMLLLNHELTTLPATASASRATSDGSNSASAYKNGMEGGGEGSGRDTRENSIGSAVIVNEMDGDGATPQLTPESQERKLKEHQEKLPNILDVLKTGLIDLVINVPNTADPLDRSAGYHIRRTAIDFSIPLISNVKNAIMFTDSLFMMHEKDFQFEIKSWNEYIREAKLEP